MEIFINEQKADITLDNEKHLGEVLAGLEQEFAQHNATTVTIAVNGKIIAANDFDSIIKIPVDDVQKLDLITIAQDDITAAFKEAGECFASVSEELKEISVQFQNGQDKAAIAAVKKLADTVDSFCHVATLSGLFPAKFGCLTIDGKTILDFFEDFAPILTEFEQALQNSDSVLMGDLAEYEISPRIDSITEMTRNLA